MIDQCFVYRAYGDCVRRIFGDCSRQLHIRLLLAVLPFAAAVAEFANGHAVIVTHD